MHRHEYDNQEFSDRIDDMRRALYSLGVDPVDRISDEFTKRLAAKESKENNLKISKKQNNRKQKV